VLARLPQRDPFRLFLRSARCKSWEKTISVFNETQGEARQLALFPNDRVPPEGGAEAVQVRLNQLSLERPRQWGACWLADHPWRTLKLDDFFGARLLLNREGSDWEKVLRVLVIYRVFSPGSEWRLHRHWFSTTSLDDLLGVDERAAQDGTLNRCHDLLLGQKSREAGFGHLRERRADLFGARCEVLLYDLTRPISSATCRQTRPARAASIIPQERDDKRGDCVQVVIALVVTPESLPLAYEMFSGNTADKTTLRGMLATICRLSELRAGRIAKTLVVVAVGDDVRLTYRLDRDALRTVRGREGRCLLRTNLAADDPALIWRCSMQLCHVEEAFRTLRGDLGLRPIFDHKPERIEALNVT